MKKLCRKHTTDRSLSTEKLFIVGLSPPNREILFEGLETTDMFHFWETAVEKVE